MTILLQSSIGKRPTEKEIHPKLELFQLRIVASVSTTHLSEKFEEQSIDMFNLSTSSGIL